MPKIKKNKKYAKFIIPKSLKWFFVGSTVTYDQAENLEQGPTVKFLGLPLHFHSWLNFFHGKSLSRGHMPTIFPKIQNHDKCLLHIQDATAGKEKTRSRQEWKCNGQPGKHVLSCLYFTIQAGEYCD